LYVARVLCPRQARLEVVLLSIRRSWENFLAVIWYWGKPLQATALLRFALCYRTVVCPVSNVGVLWPNGCMDQGAAWYGGRLRPRWYCVRWGPSSPTERKRHSSPL